MKPAHVSPRRPRQPLRGLVLLLAAGLALAPTCGGSDLPPPSFDYAMPARFELAPLHLPEQPLRPDPGDRYFAGPVRPPSWRVDLDACTSAGAIVRYDWFVDGGLVATEPDCASASIEVPNEGRYPVTLTVTDAAGATASTTQPVVVQDFLVFGLGDSYGSGEGSPDIPVPQARIAAVGAARDAVAAAEVAFANALAGYLAAERDLDEILALTRLALQRLAAWEDAVAARNDACDSFPPTLILCAEAQAAATTAAARLTQALAALGLESLFGSSTLRGVISDLEASFRNALSLAQATLSGAEDALDAARASLTQSIAALGTTWRDRRCHRSAFSGQVEAARQLEDADPRSSVTFVHLACSGATIATGLVGGYGGQEGDGSNVPSQVQSAVDIAGGREIDALVASIGGNDVGFSTLIEKCIVSEPCFETELADPAFDALVADTCDPHWPLDGLCREALERLRDGVEGEPGSASEVFATGLDGLAGEYGALAAGLAGAGWNAERAPVHLTAYPRITTRDDGSLCAYDPTDPSAEQAVNLPGVTLPEIAWADTFVAPQLAAAMGANADLHGWRFVDGHVNGFTGHGYCADDNWIVRLQESLRNQANPDALKSILGAVHPSPVGFGAYATAILDSLHCELYPGCEAEALPRAPRDSDGDGIPDERDVCIEAADPDQRDTDGDGHGNRCDADLDGDGIVGPEDEARLKAAFFGSDAHADLNGDGQVDFLDLGILNALYDGPPGPSGSL